MPARVDRLERVGGQERDLQQVVPAERVVGVLDVVLAERDRDPHRGELADRQVQRPGVRVADEAEPGPARQPGEPLQRRAGVEPDGAGVVGDTARRPGRARASPRRASRWCAGARRRRRRPASPPGGRAAAASAHIRRTCSRASASVCSIHGIPPTTSAPRSTASRTSSSAPGSRSSPSCGNATTCRSTTPRNSSRSASSGITPSSRALVSTSAKASTWRTPYRTASSTARRAFGSIQLPVVAVLDRRGQLDRVQRRAHLAGGVRRQRGVADPVQRVDLVEVHVPVDEALGHQRARRRRSPRGRSAASRPTAAIRPSSMPICQRPSRPRSVASATTSSWVGTLSIQARAARPGHGTICRRAPIRRQSLPGASSAPTSPEAGTDAAGAGLRVRVARRCQSALVTSPDPAPLMDTDQVVGDDHQDRAQRDAAEHEVVGDLQRDVRRCRRSGRRPGRPGCAAHRSRRRSPPRSWRRSGRSCRRARA